MSIAPSSPKPKSRAGLIPPHRAVARHSRVVRRARMAMTLTALAVAATLLVWPLFRQEPPKTKPGPQEGTLQLTGARYLGVDAAHRPFEVRAEQALRAEGDGMAADLAGLEAHISLKDAQWINIKATQGHYDQDRKILNLEGAISVYHSGGTELRTQAANIDVERKVGWGDRPVIAQGRMGYLEAEGFRLLNEGDAILFTGKARLRARASPPSAQSDQRP
jgi:lipopolysaccharide export system protein LptC